MFDGMAANSQNLGVNRFRSGMVIAPCFAQEKPGKTCRAAKVDSAGARQLCRR
jgi:hypothetical protein